ncbi:hypothetical protein RhoFasB10_00893 [Rhodococcus sp. B10]|uniref:Uncharacterized protein n=2 Tax=Mycobacteriales TaxID=85007 RepID=A0A177YGY1_9NOCA|nr:hypothetical protein [Rhodococcus sp. B10]OAK54804.1 hypothetical protein A3K89_05645 [Rhodococcus kyotonensis]
MPPQVRGLSVTGLLPLLWFCATLAAGALGFWWDTVGGVVVEWNQLGLLSAIIWLPGSFLVLKGSYLWYLPDVWPRARRYLTAGLGSVALCCALLVGIMLWNVVDPPEFRDPNSWSPVLTTVEQLIVAVPYAVMLILLVNVMVALWRQ